MTTRRVCACGSQCAPGQVEEAVRHGDGRGSPHVEGLDDRQGTAEWWWEGGKGSRERQRSESVLLGRRRCPQAWVSLFFRASHQVDDAAPPAPPPVFLSHHARSLSWLWCARVRIRIYYTPPALTCPPSPLSLSLAAMRNPRKHPRARRAQRIRWLSSHSRMLRLLRCITASPAVAASVAVAAAPTPTSLRPAAVCRRDVHLTPPRRQQQQQPTSAAAPASAATSTTAIAAGPYRRVGNVFIVTCIDHPFKFSWEVNRMLRELRLEFMGQTTIVPDIPQVRKRIWRVRHIVRIDQLDLDEAKALIGIPEHISFRDLAAQIPPTFGRGGSVANPHMRSKMNFMRLRRMRLRDVMHRDQLEKRLLEEKRHALQHQQQQGGGGAATAAAAATTTS
ncbi:uncharacterized protein [Leishmania mexicana MHOM/GT/2001/U1103]|uniref:Ribosomal protein L30 ferredoxin-like fold domain-containing protein n=1 Tax=Leishmania mexicana (strain MHOM/GT/2001/U1103) TaxID=929439 RepID=E9AK69_LEIMU|nr:uncharacterized protein [Leishmania mexicana MHOM/GT/2001/U1103]CBZ23319.1 unnamed protein product [Leishmania mexicana MHOM/GT/2001/U1103]